MRPLALLNRRVLITTVPFGESDRCALDLLEAEGVDYTINPLGRRLKEHELAELARGFGILIAGTEPITATVMNNALELRLISRVGIGLDNVDLAAAKARGIEVTYTPDAPAPAVAELAVGLMLSLLRHVGRADQSMRRGVWQRLMGRRLEEMTVGVIGVGRIGTRVIRILRGGFPKVRILANDLIPDLAFGEANGVLWVTKPTLYAESDVVTVHLPLTPETRGLIGASELASMKPTAVLVNTARGGIVSEVDLARALRAGRLQSAAVDVFDQEPYEGELSGLETCLLTCHMGSMSADCRTRMELEATEEAVRFLRGETLHRVVPEFEYAGRAGHTERTA